MSEATPRPIEGAAGPQADRQRPVSARAGARPNEAAPAARSPRPQKGPGPPSAAASRDRPAAPAPEPVPGLLPEADSRTPLRFTVDGTEWVVRAPGQGASGRSHGGSAPLVLLTFAPAARPDDPTREILCVGRAADRFSEQELEGLLRASRPFSRSPREQGLSADPRDGNESR